MPTKRELPLRIRLIEPPPGVEFCLQQGKSDLVGPVLITDSEIVFELSLQVGDPRPGGLPRLLGPFAQGPPDGRFVYVNSGTLAGQSDSCWTRRAKVQLSSITQPMIEEVLSTGTSVLEARLAGTDSRGGGPVCASRPLLGGGWTVMPRSSPAR